MLLLLLVCCVCLTLSGAQFQKCVNQYHAKFEQKIKHGMAGRFANYDNIKLKYSYKERVTFRCSSGYTVVQRSHHQYGKHIYTVCLYDGNWSSEWPICRGEFENVTCINEYNKRDKIDGVQQTLNEVNALYTDVRQNYPHQFQLEFRCPQGMRIENTQGLAVMRTFCGDNGFWSRKWPLCQGQICSVLEVNNGEVVNKYVKRSVGISLQIVCDPGFYLWGPNSTTCLASLQWSNLPIDCIRLEEFKNLCEKDGATMKNSMHSLNSLSNSIVPYCEPHQTIYHSKSSIGVVGISVLTVFIILCSIIGATFVVRHHRQKMLRIVRLQRELSVRYNSQHETIGLLLPSYDQVLKDKPTTPPPTFEEIYGERDRSNQGAPPAYTT